MAGAATYSGVQNVNIERLLRKAGLTTLACSLLLPLKASARAAAPAIRENSRPGSPLA